MTVDHNQPLIALEHPQAETLAVPVLRVFDGDGFLTRIAVPGRSAEIEVSIRLGFIDAPEMDQPGGHEARDFLHSLIGGQWVELVILTKMDTGGIVDRHGRVVAIPYLKHMPDPRPTGSSLLSTVLHRIVAGGNAWRNVELEMVLNGWAWVLERYGPDERYLEALDDARRHKRGIWALADNVHPWEFKKQKYRSKRLGRASSQRPSFFSQPTSKDMCPAAGCGGRLVERNGRFGTFFGCSNFPKCRCSRS